MKHLEAMGEAQWHSVRNCTTKTTPHVEKKDLLKHRLLGCPSQVQSAAAWLEWVGGFIEGATP
jgi:hypothetical protein